MSESEEEKQRQIEIDRAVLIFGEFLETFKYSPVSEIKKFNDSYEKLLSIIRPVNCFFKQLQK